MDVLVIGDFAVKAGHEEQFEEAFAGRSRPSQPPPGVKEVYFGRSRTEAGRYRRVGIWSSQQEWEDFQRSEDQQRFWSELQEHLSENPRFEFHDVLS